MNLHCRWWLPIEMAPLPSSPVQVRSFAHLQTLLPSLVNVPRNNRYHQQGAPTRKQQTPFPMYTNSHSHTRAAAKGTAGAFVITCRSPAVPGWCLLVDESVVGPCRNNTRAHVEIRMTMMMTRRPYITMEMTGCKQPLFRLEYVSAMAMGLTTCQLCQGWGPGAV